MDEKMTSFALRKLGEKLAAEGNPLGAQLVAYAEAWEDECAEYAVAFFEYGLEQPRPNWLMAKLRALF